MSKWMRVRLGLSGLLSLGGCGQLDLDNLLGKLKLQQYPNCAAVNAEYASRMQEWAHPNASQVVDYGGSKASAAAGASPTNVQVEGVDEADDVKISDTQIFTRVGSRVEVVDRATLKWIGRLPLQVPGVDSLYASGLYVDGTHLWAVGSFAQGAFANRYLIRAGQVPLLEANLRWSGWLQASRLKDHQLTLVMQDWVTDNSVHEDRDCASVYSTGLRDADTGLSRLVRLAADGSGSMASATILGSTNYVYLDADHFLLGKAGYVGGVDFVPEYRQRLVLTEIGEDLQPKAVGSVEGVPKDSYSFHARDVGGVTNYFVVTTASRDGANTQWLTSLTSQGGRLDTQAALSGFGAGEQVQAVRFHDDRAYVVTYRNVDPLFVFDLSDARTLARAGELTVPDFSSYLHPLSGHRLLGVGTDMPDAQTDVAWRVKVSLFAESPTLALLDDASIGEEASTSELQTDPHAFFVRADESEFALPFVETELDGYRTQVKAAGAKIFRLGVASVSETAQLTHVDLVPAECRAQVATTPWLAGQIDIRRVAEIDGHLVSLSSFGLKQHDEDVARTALRAETYPYDSSLGCGGDAPIGL